MVVWGKGEGGGGADRDEHQDHRWGSRASKILLAWVVISLRWYGKNALRTSRSSGGHRLLRPSTHTRAKYHQPHRSGGANLQHWDAGQDTGGSMAPAASQSYGRTVGDKRCYWGDGNKRQTDGEEARGGERCTRRQIGCMQGALAG